MDLNDPGNVLKQQSDCVGIDNIRSLVVHPDV